MESDMPPVPTPAQTNSEGQDIPKGQKDGGMKIIRILGHSRISHLMGGKGGIERIAHVKRDTETMKATFKIEEVPISEHPNLKYQRNKRKRLRFRKACKRIGATTFLKPVVEFSEP